MLETLDFLTNELSKRNDVDEILLDLSKAFDLVTHNRLIYKIKERYGLSEDLTNWIKDVLVCTKQRVVLDDFKSEWFEVESGVPQRSVLGTLLFVLYINDLPERIKNKVKLYAYDSKILAVVKYWKDLTNLQKDLS